MKLEFRQFISKITVFESTDLVAKHCRQHLEEGNRLNIAFLNAHAFNLACRSPSFVESIMASDLVLRDGIGVKILFKILGKEPGHNLNGTDLELILKSTVEHNPRLFPQYLLKFATYKYLTYFLIYFRGIYAQRTKIRGV